MRDLSADHDWIRVILIVTFSGYLLHQIYIKTEMLLDWEMGFTEVAVDSDAMKFPSVTFCPGSQNSMKWLEVDNITADFQNLRRREDILISVSQQISINKYIVNES